jgi:hypothetical protein
MSGVDPEDGNLPISERVDGFIFETFTTAAEYQASLSPRVRIRSASCGGPCPSCTPVATREPPRYLGGDSLAKLT